MDLDHHAGKHRRSFQQTHRPGLGVRPSRLHQDAVIRPGLAFFVILQYVSQQPAHMARLWLS
jgi:hypothetical protein